MLTRQQLDSPGPDKVDWKRRLEVQDVQVSLLNVLPHPSAFVGEGGRVLAMNASFRQQMVAAGVWPEHTTLSDGLAAASWRRLESVISAALSGVPSELRADLRFRNRAHFCDSVVCTAGFSIPGEARAILVQFESDAEQCGAAPAVEPVGNAPAGQEPPFAIDEFPDRLLMFPADACEDQIAQQIGAAAGARLGPGRFRRALKGCREGVQTTIHVRADRDGISDPDQTGRKVTEVRLVPFGSASGDRSLLAIIRAGVDCPEEAAENRALAYRDPLTGLANRRSFLRALDRELRRVDADGQTGLAVFYIDLDEFKKVNDLGGHDAGDDMLWRVSACLALTLGEFGTSARLGGDEFAGMLPVSGRKAAIETGENIIEAFSRIRLESANRVFTIGASVGVAYIEAGFPAANMDASSVLAVADSACLREKRSGGHAVRLQDVRMEDRSEALAAAAAEVPDATGFDEREFCLKAVPVQCLARGATLGFDVQLEPEPARSSGLSARSWIAAAERGGFISRIDSWAFDKVLDAASRETMAGIVYLLKVSVVSARDSKFRDELFYRLAGMPASSGRLCLKISERDFLREPSAAEAFLRSAADLGCSIAIDDFAGHWPVMARLSGLKLDWIKLEPALTAQVARNPSRAAILKRLVGAAGDLGVKVIAKGVATSREADLLHGLEIAAAQGPWLGEATTFAGGDRCG